MNEGNRKRPESIQIQIGKNQEMIINGQEVDPNANAEDVLPQWAITTIQTLYGREPIQKPDSRNPKTPRRGANRPLENK